MRRPDAEPQSARRALAINDGHQIARLPIQGKKRAVDARGWNSRWRVCALVWKRIAAHAGLEADLRARFRLEHAAAPVHPDSPHACFADTADARIEDIRKTGIHVGAA